MVDKEHCGQGIGSKIIEDCLKEFKQQEFTFVSLFYMKGNRQSKAFGKMSIFKHGNRNRQWAGHSCCFRKKTLKNNNFRIKRSIDSFYIFLSFTFSYNCLHVVMNI